MSFSRNTVFILLLVCIAVNLYNITSYVFGHYRVLGSGGLIFDVLLGVETGVNLVSDLMLIKVLPPPADTAQVGPPYAEVVETFRKFLMVNTGTILFCCVVHIAASHYTAQNVRVEGATSAVHEKNVKDVVFYQLAIFYMCLATVKAIILYNIYGCYKELKENPPSSNVVLFFNPLGALRQPFLLVNVKTTAASPTTQ